MNGVFVLFFVYHTMHVYISYCPCGLDIEPVYKNELI